MTYKMPPNAFETYDTRPRWMMYAGFPPEKVAVYQALWSHFLPREGEPTPPDPVTVWPSVDRIAWLSALGETKTRAILRELQDDGLVLIKPPKETGWRKNQYLLFTLSREEIEVLVNRRDSLTSTNEKTRCADQAHRVARGTPRQTRSTPRETRGTPRETVTNKHKRKNTRKEHQEEAPQGPASGGIAPSEVGQVHSTTPPGTDISSLRHRLEAHKR